MSASDIHTFVVLAYKESKYLDDCLNSLTNQVQSSNILIATSTPNDWIISNGRKYGVDVKINTSGLHGIANDWNFAYNQADTELITLAHQDDIYHPNYLKEILNGYQNTKDALILFTDYNELRNGIEQGINRNLNIKRLLLKPMLNKKMSRSLFWKRRSICMGNPICCPSVTYAKRNLPEKLFTGEMGSNIDWLAWEKLSRISGSFVYINKQLMDHRIHLESTTTKLICNNDREQEDIYMLNKFWPLPIAKTIEKFYKKSEDSNNIN